MATKNAYLLYIFVFLALFTLCYYGPYSFRAEKKSGRKTQTVPPTPPHNEVQKTRPRAHENVTDEELLGKTRLLQFKPLMDTKTYDFVYNQYRRKTQPLKRNTIVMLLRSIANPTDWLQRIDESFDAKIDLTIFLEFLPFRADILALRRFTPRNVDLVFVQGFFARPFSQADATGRLDLDPFVHDPVYGEGRIKWSYNNMIRFFFTDIFQLPQIFDDVDYVLRLDDDSKFSSSFTTLFDVMDEKKAVYFANVAMPDERIVTLGLEQLTRDYIQQKAITPKDPGRYNLSYPNGAVRVYYNNFEACSLKFFRSPDVISYTEVVLKSNGIFKSRWGDHALRYLTLSMLAEKHQVLHLEDFPQFRYCHHQFCNYKT